MSFSIVYDNNSNNYFNTLYFLLVPSDKKTQPTESHTEVYVVVVFLIPVVVIALYIFISKYPYYILIMTNHYL